MTTAGKLTMACKLKIATAMTPTAMTPTAVTGIAEMFWIALDQPW
jgi:hypothetical protein